MRLKIKTIDYGNEDVRYVVLKRNWLGLYTKLYYQISGYNVYDWTDNCMKEFSMPILYMTSDAFGSKHICLRYGLGYSCLDYFTDKEVVKYFVKLADKYGRKKPKITYEEYTEHDT
uniref:Uncharacterized protein n=1 Tax=Podoviridae sp. ctz6O13 TaxID=2827757 RepID=A0A8S5TLY5_9CAUD|nr:MAG TPA: hypothetical protein [Podoviridae sp. ctz6O13]